MADASCCTAPGELSEAGKGSRRVLLVGNPNVGKSVIFSRLTGVGTVSSNYPGTTVSFLEGRMRLAGEQVPVIDVPGSYSLDPTCPAEEVACRVLEDGGIIVNVLDATNLERNLALALQLRQMGLPMVVALNLWDEARHRGVHIDVERLSELLGVPVVPTAAVSGEGLADLVAAIERVADAPPPEPLDFDDLWSTVGAIVGEVQRLEHRHHTWRDIVEEISIRPVTGIPFGILVVLASFAAVRAIGESIITYLMDPFFESVWRPVVEALSRGLGGGGWLHDILVGSYVVVDGVRTLDFSLSLGVLTTGLYVSLGAVLPYVIAFYVVLGILEDVGYLPRLAVLLDGVMHRLGLHGYAVIPVILGFGCNVPGILATRVLDTPRERFIAATLISVGVPCAALQAMIMALLGPFGIGYVALVYGVLAVVWFVLGTILRLTSKDFLPEMVLEIPAYRLPSWQTLAKKLWMRLKGYLLEATPVVLGGVAVIAVIHRSGIFEAIAGAIGPAMDTLFGLPPEAALAIVLGFFRKDIAVGMLAPLSLGPLQLVKASVMLAVTFPCVASYMVLLREFGLKKTALATAIMVVASLTTGIAMNLVF